MHSERVSLTRDSDSIEHENSRRHAIRRSQVASSGFPENRWTLRRGEEKYARAIDGRSARADVGEETGNACRKLAQTEQRG